MMEHLPQLDYLVLAWALWAGLCVIGLIFVAAVELNAVADRIGGGNGMVLIAALILTGASSSLLILLTWYLRGFLVALGSAGGVVAIVFIYLGVFQLLHQRLLSRRAPNRL